MPERTEIASAVVYFIIGIALFFVGSSLVGSAVDVDLNELRAALDLEAEVSSSRLVIGGLFQFIGSVAMAVGVALPAARHFRP